jgi:hypothetical protein
MKEETEDKLLTALKYICLVCGIVCGIGCIIAFTWKLIILL